MTFLNLSISSFVYNFLDKIFYIYFFIYIKMSKNFKGKDYQENKERLLKEARKKNQNLSKEAKGKKVKMS